MPQDWLVIGICGVTCGGKTTLAEKLKKILPNSKVISQDDYFLDINDPRQVRIPELNHFNFELLTSMDMDQMFADIMQILKFKSTKKHVLTCLEKTQTTAFRNTIDLSNFVYETLKKAKTNVLIIEGFSIFNYKPIEAVCDLKYYFTLEEEECRTRRLKRVYEPPDCPGYFEKYVWPEYLKLFDDVQKNVSNVKYFDESTSLDAFKKVLLDIIKVLGVQKDTHS